MDVPGAFGGCGGCADTSCSRLAHEGMMAIAGGSPPPSPLRPPSPPRPPSPAAPPPAKQPAARRRIEGGARKDRRAALAPASTSLSCRRSRSPTSTCLTSMTFALVPPWDGVAHGGQLPPPLRHPLLRKMPLQGLLLRVVPPPLPPLTSALVSSAYTYLAPRGHGRVGPSARGWCIINSSFELQARGGRGGLRLQRPPSIR